MMDEYRTLREAAQDEFTEKRSRFIGYVRPVISEREALEKALEDKYGLTTENIEMENNKWLREIYL